jgi:hypothetical protein
MSGVRGVLRTPPEDAWSLHRFEPGPQLAPYTVWHWIVVWDLRGREPHHQTTLPHPATHLVVEEGGAWLYGPLRERFERTLAGAGLSPSWVIRRYRLHEAAAHATAGGDVDWARLAISLGYYDQAHLVRDFTATVGTAPARYAATASAPPPPPR